jgi:hypothetical protein
VIAFAVSRRRQARRRAADAAPGERQRHPFRDSPPARSGAVRVRAHRGGSGLNKLVVARAYLRGLQSPGANEGEGGCWVLDVRQGEWLLPLMAALVAVLPGGPAVLAAAGLAVAARLSGASPGLRSWAWGS